MQFLRNVIKWNLFLGAFTVIVSYKPVVVMHGILSGADSMNSLQREIEIQLVQFGKRLEAGKRITRLFPNDWKIAPGRYNCNSNASLGRPGHSQRGLLARATIQTMPNHNVKFFIFLPSPQAGQYGTNFLHLIFSDLASRTVYELFYSKVGQLTSVANY
uniref:Uncharacterized protein n=1 Tax=Glossina austeni TaxID=7395 RepID=A0A1A9UNT2_GLOAU